MQHLMFLSIFHFLVVPLILYPLFCLKIFAPISKILSTCQRSHLWGGRLAFSMAIFLTLSLKDLAIFIHLS